MNRFFKIFVLLGVMSGCTTPPTTTDWFADYDATKVGRPSTVEYGRYIGGYGTHTPDDDEHHRIAVLLPTSGDNATIGKTIQKSVEAAVLQHNHKNLAVTFYDTASDANDAIDNALSGNPEIIIGPLFAKNARILRDKKPESIPALSFTSDATAVGDGIMTMSLMPTNSVEHIVKQMISDGVRSFIIMAPDNNSGKIMAGIAQEAATIYNVPLGGIFYYTEQNSESIKNISKTASLNDSRTAANTKARTILADILTNEKLTALEKSDLTIQLEKISRTDTLGSIPYDAILFLGSADDTKKLVSFLRYYGVKSGDTKYYGTTMWDGTDIASDITMTGAKYATLPETNTDFVTLYEQASGATPSRLATMGYDATNMAIGMLYSDKSPASYLLNPSGYIGTDGLFRMKPAGDNERALRIVKTNGDGTVTEFKHAPTTFMAQLYSIDPTKITPAKAFNMQSKEINPYNYINIPFRLIRKYSSKSYNSDNNTSTITSLQDVVTTLPEDDRAAITVSDFEPVKKESINRTYIDEVEIEE